MLVNLRKILNISELIFKIFFCNKKILYGRKYVHLTMKIVIYIIKIKDISMLKRNIERNRKGS